MARYCPFCVSKVETGNICPHCNYAANYEVKAHHLRPGTFLHNRRYLVGRVLGEGGYGITYVGRDMTLDMKVAIKEYFPNHVVNRDNRASSTVSLVDWSFSEGFIKGKQRFIYEAQTIAKMDKESAVVTVRDFFEENQSAYIVMEYIDGKDLRDILNETGKPFEAKTLLNMVEPLFPALSELHDMGLIHRDISPDNIMMEKGRARLIDFGCARDSLRENINVEATLKHGFSPVEQYQNTGMGPWTDVYAMAATIYYCLTGRRPQRADERALRDELVSPTSLGAKLTPKQERALMKALAIRREDRYQTITEFGKDLFIHRNKYKYIAIAAGVVAAATLTAVIISKPWEKTVEKTVNIVDSEHVEILDIADSRLTSDEKEMIQQITEFLEGSSLTRDAGNTYQYNLTGTNNTDYDFDNVNFYAQFYNEAGTIVGGWNTGISDWMQGDSVQLIFRCYQADSKATVKVKAYVANGDHQLQTDYVELPLLSSGPASGITINLASELPVTVSYDNYGDPMTYKVTGADLSTDSWNSSGGSTYYGYIKIDGAYLSGPKNESGYIGYRITDASGTIYASEYFMVPTMSPGEKFANLSDYVMDLAPGEYYIQFVPYR